MLFAISTITITADTYAHLDAHSKRGSAPPIEFDEKLWHAAVDKVTVYNDDRLVYSLKDGTEITVEL